MDEDNDSHEAEKSLDDVLEEERRKEIDELEKLEEDNDTPAAPPDDVEDSLPDDHQLNDSDIDQHERYDEGTENAATDQAQESK